MNPEKRQRTSEPPGPRRLDAGEDAIGAALRSLPAETAGPGFTARVLARLGEGERASRPPTLRPAVAWALLAAAALIAAAGIVVMRSSAPQDAPDRVAESRPDEPPAVVTDAEAGTAARAGRRDPSEDGRPASGPGAARAGDPPSTAAASGEDEPSPGAPAAGVPRFAEGPARDGRPGARRSPPPAPGDTRLAAAGSRAAAGDAHDAVARLRVELDALRREHRRFEIGLADLPEVGRDGQPVVYVGGDEGLGLVLDLGRDTAPGGRRDDLEPGASL
jgi:hypothetical protein